MWRLYLIGALSLLLGFIWLGYWLQLHKSKYEKPVPHEHPWDDRMREFLSRARNGEPDQARAKICAQIIPGKWQCNCSDQTKPCLVLVKMKSEVDATLESLNSETTDRRGAIAAQKARNRK